MLHFLLSATYSTSKESEDDVIFCARDRYDFNPRKPLFMFRQTRFPRRKKRRPTCWYLQGQHLQHAVLWTCTTSWSISPIDASVFAIRSVYHAKLASGWGWHFLVISYVPGMHVIASARASSVVRAYLRSTCGTHDVRHQKDQTKCQLVNHRSMGACDAFVFQGFCVQEGHVYIVNSRNIEVILTFNRYVRPCV